VGESALDSDRDKRCYGRRRLRYAPWGLNIRVKTSWNGTCRRRRQLEKSRERGLNYYYYYYYYQNEAFANTLALHTFSMMNPQKRVYFDSDMFVGLLSYKEADQC